MTELISFAAGGTLALVWAQRKARRWSKLIRASGEAAKSGAIEQAETSLKAALAVTASARGPLWFGRRVATLLPLAQLLVNRGRYDEAAEVTVEFVEAVRRRAVDSDLIARGLSLLGDISAARGSLAEAEALYRSTLEMEERMLGPQNIDLAPTLVKLASVLQSQARRGEAAVLFHRCSDIISAHPE